MKKLLLLIFATACLYAEATFDQVQSMIDKQQYKQAVLALSVIANNHPNSSKVQFTLAQAHAGLGNLPLAKEALDKAIAINPKLDFVPAKQVEELSKTINAVRVIKRVEESTNWTLWILLMVGASFVVAFFLRSKPKPEAPTTEPKRYNPGMPRTEPYVPKSDPRPNDYRDTVTTSHKHTDKPFVSRYEPIHSRPTEIHHHHHTNNNGSDVLTTMAVAGVTAAAVSMALDNDDRPTHSYQPEPVVSDSWQDRYASESTSSTWNDSNKPVPSSTWDDTPSESNSWNDESSSSDSWSSSSDSSSSDSSSSWND
jgi:hypothetical protein